MDELTDIFVTVARVIDADGTARLTLAMNPEQRPFETIALLEWAKHQIHTMIGEQQ